jgi:hypothetical protein
MGLGLEKFKVQGWSIPAKDILINSTDFAKVQSSHWALPGGSYIGLKLLKVPHTYESAVNPGNQR